MKKFAIALVFVFLLTSGVHAQTITPTGVKQGDLVALLQNIVDALGSTVGSTYLTAGSGISSLLLSTDGTTALVINSSQNTTLGASDLADDEKLYVSGDITVGDNGPEITLQDLNNDTSETAFAGYLNLIDSDSEVGGVIGFIGSDSDLHFDSYFGALKFRSNNSVAGICNSSQNWTLGASDLAGVSRKLFVSGKMELSTTAPYLIQQDSDSSSNEVALTNYIDLTDDEDQVIARFGDPSGSSNDLYVNNLMETDLRIVSGGSTGLIVNEAGRVTVGGETDLLATNYADMATTNVGALNMTEAANGTQPTTPSSGRVTLFVETIGGKASVQCIFDDGSTAECCIQP